MDVSWEKALNLLDFSLHSSQIWCLLFLAGDQWDLTQSCILLWCSLLCVLLLVDNTIRFLSFTSVADVREWQFWSLIVNIIVFLPYFLVCLMYVNSTKDIQQTKHFPIQSLSWKYSYCAYRTWLHSLRKVNRVHCFLICITWVDTYVD